MVGIAAADGVVTPYMLILVAVRTWVLEPLPILTPSASAEKTIYQMESDRLDMDEQSHRTIAVWAVFIVPFLILAGFLSNKNQLTFAVVGLYWFPAVVLTIIGTVPPPWQPFVN
jgi:hypothetical protein